MKTYFEELLAIHTLTCALSDPLAHEDAITMAIQTSDLMRDPLGTLMSVTNSNAYLRYFTAGEMFTDWVKIHEFQNLRELLAFVAFFAVREDLRSLSKCVSISPVSPQQKEALNAEETR